MIDVKTYLEALSIRLNTLTVKLDEIEKLNKRVKDLSEKKDSVDSVMSTLVNLITLNKTLIKTAQVDYKNFKEHRLGEISKYITHSLSVVFPDRHYIANLIYDDNSSRKDVTLSLVDLNGISRYPSVTEGGLNNQIIAYSAAFGLVKAFGYNKIYVDEAFSAAHPDNLTKTSRQIVDAVESGMQVFLIQQASGGYENIPRREIHLDHCMTSIDGIEETTIRSITDFNGEVSDV